MAQIERLDPKTRAELTRAHELLNRAENFWNAYKTVKGGQARALRVGFGAYGVYPIDLGNPFDFARPESDLEHVGGVCYLVRFFNVFYPELIPDEMLSDFLLWAEFHEVGEIESGDKQDDGTRDEEAKDREEMEFLKKITEYFPTKTRKKVISLFEQFQKKDTDFGKMAFFIDKLEAVLSGLIYESQGRPGSYNNKREKIKKPSFNDRLNMEITGSTSIPDMWGCNIVLRARKYHFKHLSAFIEIMQAGAVDVRGKEMDWIQKAMNCPFDPSYL